MTVEPWQLQQNAVLDVDGSRGFVLSTDSGMTAIARDDGKIEFYTTESVAENATVHEDSPVQAAPVPQPANVPTPQPGDQPTQQPTDQPGVVSDPAQPPTRLPADPAADPAPLPVSPNEEQPQSPPPTPDTPQAVPVPDQPIPDSRQQTP